jgi:23S rRNA (cytosine1962-C5)-methyltransferase
MPPCCLFEDEHLLVVNKPAGWNTHAPSPFAGEGIYDWLRHREPRWARLALLHRLDKETSGVLVFGKTDVANRSLTTQFARHQVRKEYRLITDRPVSFRERTIESALVRAGERYLSRPPHAGARKAVTRFRVLASAAGRVELIAEPVTGYTHQIRAQAAAGGFPILGDRLYGGTSPAGPGRTRLSLHAERLTLEHPATGETLRFQAPLDPEASPLALLRAAFVETGNTNACRLIHGAAEGWPGLYVDRWGDYLLCQSAPNPAPEPSMVRPAWRGEVESLRARLQCRGVYHQTLARRPSAHDRAALSPRLLSGTAAPGPVTILENGLYFEVRFDTGGSVGLFLDQRENRRRLLVGHVAAGFSLSAGGLNGAEVLNTFAYTCAFSVCAARAGARTTSLDLSRPALEWGRRNFALNGIDTSNHDFIFGDVFDWLRRFARKDRAFDVVVLDPPTFSRSKAHGTFQAEQDFGKLVAAALPVLRPGGVLLASTNAATLGAEKFLAQVDAGVRSAGRTITARHYVPQPPDFPISREEPAHLKTVWLRID